MNRFMQKLSGFMYGRYGIDELGKVSFVFYISLFIINIITSWIPALRVLNYVIWAVETLVVLLIIFRMFSKNHSKRRKENEIYLRISRPVSAKVRLWKDQFRDRKTFIYKKCPSCKAILRLPRKAGSHTVKCPHCSNRFDIVVH